MSLASDGGQAMATAQAGGLGQGRSHGGRQAAKPGATWHCSWRASPNIKQGTRYIFQIQTALIIVF